MLFNSFHFLFFFAIVLAGFFLLKGMPRKLFLLVASYYFYMCWSTRYIWVIWGITLIDYVAGRLIEGADSKSSKRIYLWLSLGCNLGLLFFFKYFNFLSHSTNQLAGLTGTPVDFPMLNIILPVGISFHTFQAMSYTIDIYKGKVPAERSFLNYALYVAFFPQMVAGPIERPDQLLPQFRREPKPALERFCSGAKWAMWGVFKKMIVADSLARIVNAVYARPEAFDGRALLVATVAFAIQIYCDFSGYSDIAIGIARMMGYELRINFTFPYFSRSVAEFWRRWHISLSTWFRDYVYIPLGGNRVRVPRMYVNLLITFIVSGLWHGASWTFAVWGGLHGLYLVLSYATKTLRAKATVLFRLERLPLIHAACQRVWTFVIVTAAWVFFRSPSFSAALYVLKHMSLRGGPVFKLAVSSGLSGTEVPFLLALTVLLFVVEWFIQHPQRLAPVWSLTPFRYGCYYACAYSVVFFGVFGHSDFIYFQF
jgi:D-alanyl-lipoteichoic acid acyltransferase DltB (MBOAT superfamily)